MKEITIDKIVNLARLYNKNNIPWHQHLLTLKCSFNKTKKFQVILENEQTGESFIFNFDYKPMKEMEILEELFFKKKLK